MKLYLGKMRLRLRVRSLSVSEGHVALPNGRASDTTYSKLTHPSRDLIHHFFVHFLLRRDALRNLQRMISLFNRIERRRQSMLLNNRADFILSSECIARALHEEHRCLDLRQMFVTQLVRTPRWMQRITKKDQACDAIAF